MSGSDQQQLNELLQRWQKDELDASERQALFNLLTAADQQGRLSSEMQEAWTAINAESIFSHPQKEKMLAGILGEKKSSVFSFRRLVAAASLLAVVMLLAFFLTRSSKTESQATLPHRPAPTKQTDIQAPVSNKAVLTLADGRQIILENKNEGKLATEGDMNIRLQGDGQLVYEGNTSEIEYNTLSVPRGSPPVKLVLADGSNVTLNVASSLTYPTSFHGTSRTVKLTGEAYFEVARRPSAAVPSHHVPFVVEAAGMQVNVTGTRFNVNAYPDEDAMKTTLLEGAVNVQAGPSVQPLQPGEQAIITTRQGKGIKVDSRADLDEVMAWVNGKFRFTNADAASVMRQVSRWYDVEVKFAAKPAIRFGGQVDRNSTLRQMFTILETSGLHFSLNGKTVTVLP